MLEDVQKETRKDESFHKLRVLIQNGWPDEKGVLPQEEAPYFFFRDEMTATEDIIFKGERVVVPHSLRRAM